MNLAFHANKTENHIMEHVILELDLHLVLVITHLNKTKQNNFCEQVHLQPSARVLSD